MLEMSSSGSKVLQARSVELAMKNNVTHRKGFSSCVNGRFHIHLIKVIKYNIAIEASVPAMLNVLHINNR